MLEELKTVRKTLETVQVTGYENMYKLVGCIQYIDKMIEEVQTGAVDHVE